MGRIEKTDDDCWIWQGAKKKSGHSTMTINVHRFVYEMLVGPVPEHLWLDHFHCDNPSCLNPKHLRPVTPLENTLRGNGPAAIHASTTHCPKGHPYDEENTYVYIDKKGFPHRLCRICRREANHARQLTRAKKRGGPGYGTRPA
jgi:hypothetical protein